MTPEISIVFTSYNHKEYLNQAIDNLLAQTFTDFELIIVDDCSTDGSQEVLKTFKDERINLFLLAKNTGNVALSTNYGVEKAKGKFLIFAQCDDFAETTLLERLYSKIKHDNVGVVFCQSNMVDELGKRHGTDYSHREKLFQDYCKENILIPSKLMTRFLFHSCVIPNMSAALIKKNLFIKVNGLSSQYKVVNDWNMWLQLAKQSDFYYIAEPLNNFRQHQTTVRNTIKIAEQVDEIFKMFSLFIQQNSLDFKELVVQKRLLSGIFIWFYDEIKSKNILTLVSLFRSTLKYDKLASFFIIKNLINKELMTFYKMIRNVGS